MSTERTCPLCHQPVAPDARRGHAVAFGAGALLALLLLWYGLGGFEAGSFPRRTGSDDPLTLDSFSPPSVACAMLSQEADRLLLAYTEIRDQEGPTAPRRPGDSARAQGETRSDGAQLGRTPPSRLDSSITAVARLQAEVENLCLDLDGRLLWFYFENHRDREFLDHYLHLLNEAPARRDVLTWFVAAWDCAQGCDRVGELTDALGHVTRFRGDLPSTKALTRLLQQRGPMTSVGVAPATR